jgi:hypothetical protein
MISSPYLLSDHKVLDAVKLPPHFGFAAFRETADKRTGSGVNGEADHFFPSVYRYTSTLSVCVIRSQVPPIASAILE